SFDDLLERGELDAIAAFVPPAAATDGSGRVRRLFPDSRAVEADYYRRTRIFPIMHMIVVRREIYEANRWVAQSLMQAFEAAKRRCYKELRYGLMGDSSALTPWLRQAWEEAAQLFGDDLYPYGIQPSLPTLEAATQYSHEQHLSARRLAIEELFAPETL